MERTFEDRLSVTLTLTVGGEAHEIIAGSIKRLALELHAWGCEGEVEFLLTDNKSQGGQQKDALLAAFLKPDLIEAQLVLQAVLPDATAGVSPTALTVKGLVTDKSLVEDVITTGDSNLVLHRRYSVRFQDTAQLLWRQHFPTALFTGKTVKDVLEAHKGEQVTLTYDWDAGLGAEHPVLFLGLAPEDGASFYDWVMGYVHEHGGIFTHDYTTHGYAFAGAKDTKGTPLKLYARNLSSLEVLLPEVIRHEVTVLNATAVSPQTKPVAHKHAVSGIRQDVLLCTPIADEVQARVDRETARLKPRGSELELHWRSFPEKAVVPGTLVKLPANDHWLAAGVAKDEVLRVRSLHLYAEVGPDEGEEVYGEDFAMMSLQLSTRLERKAEPHVDLPPWRPAVYPRYVEGLIVSEQGEDKDETWQAYTDDATSLEGYKVKLPLFEDQVVPAPFNPNLLPGHFYFPAYKGERVLVGLDFQRAWIKRFLDWRTGARMPQAGQGVQLLVGKTPENGTALKHFYKDDKPVFLMQRTNDKDTQKIQLNEGTLLIQVKEESS